MVSFEKKKLLLFSIFVIIIYGIVLRGLFLVADPPSDLSVSGALVGDAGQQSYGARNKILFGQWSFDDWKPHVACPLISILINYPVYRIFGINFYSHKIIPLFFSSFALLFFVFMIYRYTGTLTCLLSSVFISLSYPVIIFSKAANRFFPMIFFLVVALYFFIEGSSKKKNKFFVISAVFFIFSFLSHNHVLYLISLFFVLGILWLIERKIQLRCLLLFFGTVFVGLITWFLLIFLPYRDFFYFFVEHNKLVRNIYSLKQLFKNIVIDNPFLFQVRNDPLLLIFSSVAIMIYIKLKLDKKNKIPFIVDASVIWLLIGTVFHSIWTYRPTRFYLVLIFPASLLAGWILSYLIKNRFKIEMKRSSILSLMSLPFLLVFIGIFRYWRFLKFHLSSTPVLWLCFFLFITFLYLILFLKKRKRIIGFIVLLLLFSFVSNQKYFFGWAKNREYKIVNTAHVLKKAIPPSNIAGNWASILSIGTPHKTHLLFDQMGVNWRRGFFKEHNVKYLLLTRGRFDNELRSYKRFFREELAHSKRIALFKMYRSEVHLISLDYKTEEENRVEFETLIRNSGTVIFDPLASSKMSLKFEPSHLKEPVIMDVESISSGEHLSTLKISGKGNFKGRMVVQQNGKTIKEGFVKFNAKNYQEKNILTIPLKEDFKIVLKISKTEGDIFLDYLDFIPD